MLKRRGSDFVEMVWGAASIVGRSAPRVTDHILQDVFPETVEAAGNEGAFSMLRQGVIGTVTKILRGAAPDERQMDFASIDPRFQSICAELKSQAYYVEAIGEQVAVADLIADPQMLDDARKFMRQKGLECLEEASRLDRLYNAVTDKASA